MWVFGRHPRVPGQAAEHGPRANEATAVFAELPPLLGTSCPCRGGQMCHLPLWVPREAPRGPVVAAPAPSHCPQGPACCLPWGQATVLTPCGPLCPCPATSPGSRAAPSHEEAKLSPVKPPAPHRPHTDWGLGPGPPTHCTPARWCGGAPGKWPDLGACGDRGVAWPGLQTFMGASRETRLGVTHSCVVPNGRHRRGRRPAQAPPGPRCASHCLPPTPGPCWSPLPPASRARASLCVCEVGVTTPTRHPLGVLGLRVSPPMPGLLPRSRMGTATTPGTGGGPAGTCSPSP